MSYVDRAIWSVDDGELQENALKEWFAMRDRLALLEKRAVSFCAVHGTYPEPGEPCWQCANPFIEKAYAAAMSAKLLHDTDFTEALAEPEPPLAERVEREIATDLQWLTDSAYGQADLEVNRPEA